MKLRKVNASLQSVAPQCERFISLPMAVGAGGLVAMSSLGFWVIAVYFAVWAVFTSFHPRQARLQRIKSIVLRAASAATIYLLISVSIPYAYFLSPIVFLIAICAFLALPFICFKIYHSYFRHEQIEIRDIPDVPSKPTLFINS